MPYLFFQNKKTLEVTATKKTRHPVSVYVSHSPSVGCWIFSSEKRENCVDTYSHICLQSIRIIFIEHVHVRIHMLEYA